MAAALRLGRDTLAVAAADAEALHADLEQRLASWAKEMQMLRTEQSVLQAEAHQAQVRCMEFEDAVEARSEANLLMERDVVTNAATDAETLLTELQERVGVLVAEMEALLADA